MRAAAAGVVLVIGSWWINAQFASPGWACDRQSTGYDMWPTESSSLAEVLASTHPPEGAATHDTERGDDYVVRQYLLDGGIVQQVVAQRAQGQWRVGSVTSCGR